MQKNENIWKIPIKIKTNLREFYFLLEKNQYFIEIPELKAEEFYIILNADSIGYYRTIYSENLQNKIIENLGKLKECEIFGFIQDLIFNCEDIKISELLILSILRKLKGKTNFLIWNSINLLLKYWIKMPNKQTSISKIKEILSEFFEESYWEFGGFGAIQINQLNYFALQIIGKWLVIFAENKAIIENCIYLYNLHKKLNWLTIKPELRQIIYIVVVKNIGKSIIKELWEYYNTPNINIQEKIRILIGLNFEKNLTYERSIFLMSELEKMDATEKVYKIVLRNEDLKKTLSENKEKIKNKIILNLLK